MSQVAEAVAVDQMDAALAEQARGIAASRQALEAAAEAGDPDAQCTLAILLLEGSGYPRSPEHAAMLLSKAAERGHAGALFKLAELRAEAAGGEMDAVALWAEAARRGSPAAMFALGRAFLSGDGAPKDEAAARARFEEAAHIGYAPAMHEFGLALAAGVGGAKDMLEGFGWLFAACALDCPEPARSNLVALAAQLGPEELARARRRGVALARLYLRERRQSR